MKRTSVLKKLAPLLLPLRSNLLATRSRTWVPLCRIVVPRGLMATTILTRSA